jgi:hypothetical protein
MPLLIKRCTVPAVTRSMGTFFAELPVVWHAVTDNIIADRNKSFKQLPMVGFFFIFPSLSIQFFTPQQKRILFSWQKSIDWCQILP